MSGCIILGLAHGCRRMNQKWSISTFHSRSAWVEAICPKKMLASPKQIEVLIAVDPFQTADSAAPCVESSESAEPVDPSVDC